MTKIIQYLLLALFFLLPLIHGQLFISLGFDFKILLDGNFEFFKSQFFIFFISIICFLYALSSIKQEKYHTLWAPILFWIWLLFLSSIFSISPYQALFGSNIKWHGVLLFLACIWLYFVLIQQDKNFMKQLFWASVSWAVFASLIAIKEYYAPSFDYWDLSNRALWTFWHPNYLAAYILVLFPFLIEKAKKYDSIYLVMVPLVVCLLLTKSAWAILIFFSYIWFVFLIHSGSHEPSLPQGTLSWASSIHLVLSKGEKWKVLIPVIVGLWVCFLVYQFWLLTKLHSFLSRFFIWESVLRIIIDNPKVLLFGSWADTLMFYFENYKVPELYLFENFGYYADRPHNIILNIFFHFWVWGVWIMCFWIYKIIQKWKNNYLYHSLLIAWIFSIFNFFSISVYAILVLILACISRQNTWKSNYLIALVLITSSLVSLMASGAYFYSETKAKMWKYQEAVQIFPYHYKNYEKLWDAENSIYYAGKATKNLFKQFIWLTNYNSECNNMLEHWSSAETYFYCGNYAWNIWEQETAKWYYRWWLMKIPNIWDKESVYHSLFLTKNFIDGRRFFSEKYSNIWEVLERMWYDR